MNTWRKSLILSRTLHKLLKLIQPISIAARAKAADMEVKFDEEPAKKTVSKRYKQSENAANLNRAELELIEHMAKTTGQDLREAQKIRSQ